MLQAFISVNGKVIFERDKLFIRTLQIPSITNAVFFELLIGLIAFGLVISVFFVEDRWQVFINILFSAVILLPRIYTLYDILFKRSLSSRIPLSRIKSFEVKPDEVGLETYVFLHLKNGRYKKIHFRTLEKQFEPFLELLSQKIFQPQLA